ncbi:triosephosphate isomerase [Nocardia goodfellowii]|uniref:Triosephosphate isomerase n=1 Tax=Nocardia goodfellowii TaxID=882446 RepID=A0ABS4QPH4_9NOCA|nr:triosephosphate isomerase [Nocardia goodfellowii]
MPGPLIRESVATLRGTSVAVGAQDAWYEDGEYTGEDAPSLLAEIGCTDVMVGHADRRARGETDELIAKKVAGVHRSGMKPLICIGEAEHLSTREAAEHAVRQLDSATRELADTVALRVMYEPAWTVGAAAAAPDHVAAVCAELRQRFADRGATLTILYGGGVVSGTYTDLIAAGADIGGMGLGRVTKDRELLADVLCEIQETAP